LIPSNIGIHGNTVVDIWSRLSVPSGYDRKNREFCQLWIVFRVIYYK
jgi:hypothetical protein